MWVCGKWIRGQVSVSLAESDNPSVTACAVPPPLAQGRLKRGETLDEHSRNDTGLYMERSALCTCELNPPCRIRDIPPLGKGGLKGAVAVDDCKNDTVHQ